MIDDLIEKHAMGVFGIRPAADLKSTLIRLGEVGRPLRMLGFTKEKFWEVVKHRMAEVYTLLNVPSDEKSELESQFPQVLQMELEDVGCDLNQVPTSKGSSSRIRSRSSSSSKVVGRAVAVEAVAEARRAAFEASEDMEKMKEIQREREKRLDAEKRLEEEQLRRMELESQIQDSKKRKKKSKKNKGKRGKKKYSSSDSSSDSSRDSSSDRSRGAKKKTRKKSLKGSRDHPNPAEVRSVAGILPERRL